MPFETEDYDREELDPSRVSRGIAAGFMLAVPLWSAILLLMGSQPVRKAVLNLLCLTVAAAAVWIAKAIVADPAVPSTSERVGATRTRDREGGLTEEWISIR